jgi:hypothetical protein
VVVGVGGVRDLLGRLIDGQVQVDVTWSRSRGAGLTDAVGVHLFSPVFTDVVNIH